MLNIREIFYNLIKNSSSFSCVLILSFLSYYLFFLRDTGGPQIVLFLRPQGTVLLRKPYYLGTDLVLKLRFMTFGLSKFLFLASFQAILIFETKKVIDILSWPYGHLRLSNLLFPALVTLAPKIVFVTGKMTNVME